MNAWTVYSARHGETPLRDGNLHRDVANVALTRIGAVSSHQRLNKPRSSLAGWHDSRGTIGRRLQSAASAFSPTSPGRLEERRLDDNRSSRIPLPILFVSPLCPQTTTAQCLEPSHRMATAVELFPSPQDSTPTATGPSGEPDAPLTPSLSPLPPPSSTLAKNNNGNDNDGKDDAYAPGEGANAVDREDESSGDVDSTISLTDSLRELLLTQEEKPGTRYSTLSTD